MSSPALPTKVTYNEQTDELDRSIGVLFIGYSISMVLYGLTSYRMYNHKRWPRFLLIFFHLESYIYYSTLQGETRLRKYAVSGLLGIYTSFKADTVPDWSLNVHPPLSFRFCPCLLKK